jgi:hypothetical protein
MSGNSTESAALESRLWDDFCRLRLQSRAYRAVDDPIVAGAYNDWLASYLADSETPQATNVIPFRKPGVRA